MNTIIDRALANWKTTLAGTLSAAAGVIGLYRSIYYPMNNAPKWILLASGVAGYITNLLAKDK
jgi:hypothetical protein